MADLRLPTSTEVQQMKKEQYNAYRAEGILTPDNKLEDMTLFFLAHKDFAGGLTYFQHCLFKPLPMSKSPIPHIYQAACAYFHLGLCPGLQVQIKTAQGIEIKDLPGGFNSIKDGDFLYVTWHINSAKAAYYQQLAAAQPPYDWRNYDK